MVIMMTNHLMLLLKILLLKTAEENGHLVDSVDLYQRKI